MLNAVTQHLMHPKGYARVLFIDFSSAFNSMKIHILLKRAADLKVHPSLIWWFRDFLSCRPQRVCARENISEVLTVSTGCPQGSVLSPVLFSLFTNEFMINEKYFKLFKYADDMALVALLLKSDPRGVDAYLAHTVALEGWCHTSQLEINVGKTKELFMLKPDITILPVSLDGQVIESVEDFKYLGTVLDSQMSFSANTEYIYKKCSQRLYLLRKLNSFSVSQHVLELVYKTMIESVLTFHLSAWFGHLNCKFLNKLSRIVSMASKIIGKPQKALSLLYRERVRKKALSITADGSHPLSREFVLLHSGRRYRVPLATKNIYKKSFVPRAVSILNSSE